MTQRRRPGRSRRTSVLSLTAGAGALVLAGGIAPAGAGTPAAAPAVGRGTTVQAREAQPFYDSRSAASGAAAQALQQRGARVAAGAPVARLRAGLGDQGVVTIDPLTGTPRQVARLDGFLTGRSSAGAAAVTLGYVRAHRDVFGLGARDLAGLKLRRSWVDADGTTHLSYVQTARGVPLFGNGVQGNVARDGRLVSILGSPVAGLDVAGTTPGISGAAAIGRARRDLREGTTAGPDDTASLVLFRTATGTRLAWATITMSARHPAQHVLDAATGRLLYRRSLSADANRGKAWEYYPGAPRGGAQKTVDLGRPGWLRPGANRLVGNNAHVYADVNDSNKAEGTEEIPPSSGSNWTYDFQPFTVQGQACSVRFLCSWSSNLRGSWMRNRNQNATQVFYYVNTFHDHLAAKPISFTEAAGNFQAVNSSGSGRGGDPVKTEPDDGASTGKGMPDSGHVDNANMSTPPDGISPRMQMYLFHSPYTGAKKDPFISSNGGDEADVVYHEYTHGLSNRLVVDAGGNSTLGSIQAGSMGEAWSDWYAMDFLANEGYQKDTAKPGEVLVGRYVSAGQRLIRTQAIDCPVGSTSPRCSGTKGAGRGGYTYGDFGTIIGAPEVHADGEIWGETLWDLRSALGSRTAEALVTRAMSLSPNDPSFLDMRNSILQADRLRSNGAHVRAIWKVFAHRGMGFFAAATGAGDTHPVQDFSLPPAKGSARGSLSGSVTDRTTGKPVTDAVVEFGGHASGFAGSYAAVTGSDGRYRISGIFTGTYPKVRAYGPGYEAKVDTVRIRRGNTTRDWRLQRDWAAGSGGARVVAFNGPDYTPYGCGPRAAIDLSLGTGWGSTSELGDDGKPSAATPKHLVVKLPRAVDISTFQVDPSNTCGDAASAATAKYRIDTSTNGSSFVQAAAGTFGPKDLGHLNAVSPAGSTGKGVRYVKFTMITPQVFEIGGSCPGAYSGCDYLDMTELEVYGTP